MEHKINDEFVEEIRLSILGYKDWDGCFKDSKPNEIVPEQLSHIFLKANHRIDNNILKFYCLPSLVSDSEFMEMNKDNILGKKETAFQPYTTKIFGAYFKRSDLYTKLIGTTFDTLFINGNKIELFTDLEPYFRDYSDGFKKGFNEFDNDIITPYLTLLADKQDYVNKVFEFLTKDLFCSHSWAGLRSGFHRQHDNNIVDGFNDGQKQGHFYRAWTIVFSNNNLFAPLFQDLMQPKQNIIEAKRKKIFDAVIDGTKYDTAKIFTHCTQKNIFECEESTFIAWLVDGTGSHKRIKWVFDNGKKAQLRTFMNAITGREVTPAQINMAFTTQIDSNNHPSKKLDKILTAILTFSSLSNK